MHVLKYVIFLMNLKSIKFWWPPNWSKIDTLKLQMAIAFAKQFVSKTTFKVAGVLHLFS